MRYVAELPGSRPVHVDLDAPLAHDGSSFDRPLAPEIADLFVDALAAAGVPIGPMLANVDRLRQARPDLLALAQQPGAAPGWAVDPQPYVFIDQWPQMAQPWPVMVDIGSDCIAEFYPQQLNKEL